MNTNPIKSTSLATALSLARETPYTVEDVQNALRSAAATGYTTEYASALIREGARQNAARAVTMIEHMQAFEAQTFGGQITRLDLQAARLPWWARWFMRRRVRALREAVARHRDDGLRRMGIIP